MAYFLSETKMLAPKVISFVTTIGISLLVSRCANESNFNSQPKTRTELRTNDNAQPDESKQSDNANKESQPAQVTVSGENEVAAPAIKFGTDFDVSSSMEVPPTKLPVYEVIKADFPVSIKLEGKLSVNPQDKSMMTSVILAQSFSKEKDVFTQSERPVVTDLLKQGNPGIAKEENFSQANMGIVDIQIVVDNSGSMADEQFKVSTKLPDLLKYIGNSNWQINIATTDPANGCSSSQGIIKRGEADAETRFKEAVKAGIGGDGNERGILQAVNGLSCATAPNWVRPNSKIAVLIVSDEDNCSDGKGCGTADYAYESFLLNYLTGKIGRQLGKGARVYGIVGKPTSTGAKACTELASFGTVYLKAISATGGYVGEICDTDYTQTFQKISQDVANLLDTKYSLQAIPDAMSIKVYVNSVEIPRTAASGATNWEIDPMTNKDLVFKAYVPQYTDSIKVTYTVGANSPLVKSFALTQSPFIDPSAIFNVYVNGLLVQKGVDYQYSSATNSIVFTTEPSADAEIKIVYKKAINLPLEFKLLKTAATGKPLQVLVNGAQTAGFTYADQTGKIVFNTPPPEAASIVANYEALVGPITRYPLVLSGTQIINPSIYYESNNQSLVGAKLEGSTLVVSEQGFMPGEKVIVKYFNENSGVLTVKLPQKPLANSLKITASEGNCTFSSVSETFEVVLNCTALGSKTIDINWSYQTEIQLSFMMDKVLRPEVGTWVVKIDGVKITEYTRNGQKITLVNTPPPTAIVTIEYTEEI